MFTKFQFITDIRCRQAGNKLHFHFLYTITTDGQTKSNRNTYAINNKKSIKSSKIKFDYVRNNWQLRKKCICVITGLANIQYSNQKIGNVKQIFFWRLGKT